MQKSIYYLVILALFVPLLLSSSFLFPYVFLKSIVFRIIVSLAILLLTWGLFKNKLRKIEKNWMVISLCSFLLVFPIMSVFGINIGESLWGGFERMEGMFYYVYLALFLLVLLQVLYNDQRWKNVFLSITVANILISALAILQKFNITLGIAAPVINALFK